MDITKLKAYTEAFLGNVKVGAIGYFGNSPEEIEDLISRKASPHKLEEINVNLFNIYRTGKNWYKLFYEL